MSNIVVRKVGGLAGARIDGVDFSQSLTDSIIEQVASALFEHQVVSLQATDMTTDQHAQLARRFGELEHNATDQFGVDDQYPFLTIIDSEKGDRADSWHCDETFLQHPPLVNLLHCKHLPEHGGDTAFISTAAAYDALSNKMKSLLDGLTAVHDYGHLYELGWRSGIPLAEMMGEALVKGLVHSHPVVREHRETGRKWLSVNSTYTRHIEGLNPIEADAILRMLLAHMQKPEFMYRHRWQEGELVLWDQQCVQHYAVQDFEGRRVMQRISALETADTYTGVKSAP